MKKVYLVKTKFGLQAFSSNKAAKKFARIMNCVYEIIPLEIHNMCDI